MCFHAHGVPVHGPCSMNSRGGPLSYTLSSPSSLPVRSQVEVIHHETEHSCPLKGWPQVVRICVEKVRHTDPKQIQIYSWRLDKERESVCVCVCVCVCARV
jgi:hypothetical protein